MSLKNCKRCGKLFNSQGYSVCPPCLEKDRVDFERIREYMLTHPYVSALELSRETGVKPAVITRFQREGRFISREQQEAELRCTACGEAITAGQICNDCLKKLGSPRQRPKKNKQ